MYLVMCIAHIRVFLEWNSSTVILKLQWPGWVEWQEKCIFRAWKNLNSSLPFRWAWNVTYTGKVLVEFKFLFQLVVRRLAWALAPQASENKKLFAQNKIFLCPMSGWHFFEPCHSSAIFLSSHLKFLLWY